MGDEPASRVGRWRVRRFDTIDSTNRWLLDEARRGAPEGLVAVADHQSAGRGRRGRTWSAPPGSSLLVSVLLRPRIDAERVHVLTMAAAVALRAAVQDVAGVPAGIKWPNDLVVDDRKLAGLLAETELTADGEVGAVVVGAGCNVQWTDFPPEIAEDATACNLEAGHDVDRAEVLTAFLDRMSECVDDLAAVPGSYRGALATLGRRVRVDLGNRVIEGAATDLDDVGRLIVTTAEGTNEVVAVGDVVHLRDA
jgi:BirA family biotin operon repressor/biotin-[acetyl-CoA-carboxylase] ligase